MVPKADGDTFSIHFDEIRNNHKPPCQSNIINIEGGEKGLTCEWDRLMELPKEEPDYDELDLILYGVDADYVTDLIMKED